MKNPVLIKAAEQLQQQYNDHKAIIEGGFEALMKQEAAAHESRMKGFESMRQQQLRELDKQYGVGQDSLD